MKRKMYDDIIDMHAYMCQEDCVVLGDDGDHVHHHDWDDFVASQTTRPAPPWRFKVEI